MDVKFGDLSKMTIKQLKRILVKLHKEPKNVETLTTIDIIKTLITDKKRKGTILHPEVIMTKNGPVPQTKCKSVHLQ